MKRIVVIMLVLSIYMSGGSADAAKFRISGYAYLGDPPDISTPVHRLESVWSEAQKEI